VEIPSSADFVNIRRYIQCRRIAWSLTPYNYTDARHTEYYQGNSAGDYSSHPSSDRLPLHSENLMSQKGRRGVFDSAQHLAGSPGKEAPDEGFLLTFPRGPRGC
jgi:hypothetical protein